MENQFTTSLWGDEGFSAILSMKSLPEIIKIIANDTSPPLWNITEWIVFNTLGTNEIYIRSLAFTYFLLSVIFTYKIGKMLWDKKTGITAAILTFLNPFFFTYAFEGRMYSILALGVTASMYFFLKLIYSNKIKRKDQIGYIIATLWALYSHHFAIFALLTQGLWFLKELFTKKHSRNKLRKILVPMFKTYTVIGIGYLPWLIPLYNQTRMVGGGFWLGTPTVKDFIKMVIEYLSLGIKHNLSKLGLISTLLILISRNWKQNIKNSSFAVTWFLGPILLTWIISQFFQSIFFNRYLLYTIPAAMLLLASERKKLSVVSIIATIIIFGYIDLYYFTHPTKRPFRQLATYVQNTKQENDFLINWNASSHHIWESKYYNIYGPIYIPEEGELPFFVGTALMEEKDIIHTLPEKADRIGVITSGPVEDINLPGYTKITSKNFQNPWEGASEINFAWYAKK